MDSEILVENYNTCSQLTGNPDAPQKNTHLTLQKFTLLAHLANRYLFL